MEKITIILGLFYNYIGKHKEALKYLNKAITIYKKNLGDMHQLVASAYNNIGLVYMDMGENQKALEYFNRAIRHFRKNIWKRSPYY